MFDYVDQRYLSPQIPGGTVEPGEAPESAAVREAREETGLNEFILAASLGDGEKDLRPFGRDEVIHAWFFHLTTSEVTPTRWRHMEEYASEGSDNIEFELYWVPVNKVPTLGGLDNTMLGMVRSVLSTANNA